MMSLSQNVSAIIYRNLLMYHTTIVYSCVLSIYILSLSLVPRSGLGMRLNYTLSGSKTTISNSCYKPEQTINYLPGAYVYLHNQALNVRMITVNVLNFMFN